MCSTVIRELGTSVGGRRLWLAVLSTGVYAAVFVTRVSGGVDTVL